MQGATLKRQILFVLIGLLMLVGCATYPLPSISTPPAAEDWVAQGSGAATASGTRLFYGVGEASGIRNTLILRASADNNAQKELADVLTAFLGKLSADSDGETDRGTALYSLVQAIMADAVIVDHIQDNANDRYYALCRVTLDSVKSHLATDTMLAPETRQAMLAHADEWHARMARGQ